MFMSYDKYDYDGYEKKVRQVIGRYINKHEI